MRKIYIFLSFILITQVMAAQESLLNILKTEVDRNYATLKNQPVPAHYINYRVFDTEEHNISAQFGNLVHNRPNRTKYYHIGVRVGSPELDNSHEIKDSRDYSGGYLGTNGMFFENSDEIRKRLWVKTDEYYKNAVKQFEKVKANVAVKVASEDKSPDFSIEKPEKYIEKPVEFKNVKLDVKKWEEKVKKYSAIFKDNKDIFNCGSNFSTVLRNYYFVDSEGAEILETQIAYRINIYATTTAEDGMDLPLYQSYFAFDPKDLPSDDQIMKDAKDMSTMISRLKKAPLAETYSGPALLSPEASGVFFHEIFGHRIEGARLKKETDAQTFKKKVGEIVLPEEFSIIFDPQATEYKGFKLAGNYKYDDEGVKGQKVTIVEHGRLKNFLMSRTPIEGFPNSNGHGRAMIYFNTVTRQSNMFLESTKQYTDEQLRTMLKEQAKQAGKEYGYYFDKVSGGFTTTGRYMPNAFNVTPLIVYKIYVDGRPDELVRGVDLVGTPLSMFSQIAACGKEYGIFNGFCGAESGSIPVSSVTPAVFVKMIETQKKGKSQSKQPILDRP